MVMGSELVLGYQIKNLFMPTAIKITKSILTRVMPKLSLKIVRIEKRDGRVVPFDDEKIYSAIHKAFIAVRESDGKEVKILTDEIGSRLNQKFAGRVPRVEQIQDLVVETLYDKGYKDVADAYTEYRKKRQEIREAKYFLLYHNVKTNITENSFKVLESRYLRKDENGKVIETPQQLFRRIASNIAAAEKVYNPDLTDEDLFKFEEKFYRLLASLEFLPNSPTIMNAGTPMQQLSACFVIPVEDSMESIFDAVKGTAIIHKSGGGTGYSFSRLRPKGDIIKTTQGVSSGPVSFMTVFDKVADVVKQGGKRRGAMMGILKVDHPDILEFISAKTEEGILQNFNISVAITEEFMNAVKKGATYKLIHPKTMQPVKELDACEVFDKIVRLAWQTGDPGVVFIERMNNDRGNPTPKLGKIESTNPCGEQPLLPNEPCNLGSIDVNKMIKKKGNKYGVDWDKLRQTVQLSVRFLDNVIEMNRYPLPEIDTMGRGNRRIGLGIMGWADLLVNLEIPYNSKKAMELGDKLMGFINNESHKASIELAKNRGVFPNFRDSVYDKPGGERLRNCAITTIAPTGTIGIIAGCSQGIEPKFALAYVRKSRIAKNENEWAELVEVDKQFENVAKRVGFYSEKVMKEVARRGSVAHIEEVPEKWKKVFITAHDLKPEEHVKTQAVFQKHVDNAVSKTINFPSTATVDDVKKAYLLAWDTGCKGITIYRDESKSVQVLNLAKDDDGATAKLENKIGVVIDTNVRTEIETKDPSPSGELPPGVCLTCN
ncbi:MAG: Ribonucleoside-diphosphate reductase [Parcubacteria group bacterium GW2011_GWA2_42_14]|nr:MAG: Ribonucleoside-diphosphate reductase [Parcubacteria group bacterium GW2011_GWA2_42_14]